MKRLWKILCAVMALMLLLTGCGGKFTEYLENLAAMAGYVGQTAFEDMAYTRPDMDAHQAALDSSCETVMNSSNIDEVITAINDYYAVFDDFCTNYNLAYIRYCQDVTDTYWSDEYDYCAVNYPELEAGLETLYYTLADCPWREELETDEYFGEDYFLAYDGENIWDEEFIALMDEEARLQNRYYELYEQSLEAEYYTEEFFTAYGQPMAQVFVELIAQRQKIAACAGYDSYPQFAYDFYYYRDYTPEEAEAYLLSIAEEMVELYRQVNQSDVWDLYTYCSEADTLAYGRETAKVMGGDIWDAFQVLEENGVYDIAYGENKYSASFELYLNSYYMPFLFMSPIMDSSDKLTFVHEFGHFANDYLCWGSYAGTDVAEVHSQAMEYLSLVYGPADEDLVKIKMADCLMAYMEQAAYALFEHQVYSLTADALTVENVQALYEQIGLQFGFDSWGWDSRDYVIVEHYFSSPMYIISYVTSNDVAFQIYQKELEHKGDGLAIYEECLYSEESYIVCFAETYGLESPFAEGRVKKVTELLESLLG